MPSTRATILQRYNPDMIEFGEGHDIPIELWGIHSRMLNWNRTVSEIVPDRDTITPLRAHMMNRRMQQTGSNHECAAKDIHLAEIRHRRAIENDTHLPFEQMNDEQLVHQYHYTFFPNTTFTQTPEGGAVFRYRPHATDPAKCYYDFFIMSNPAPGEPRNERPTTQNSPTRTRGATIATYSMVLLSQFWLMYWLRMDLTCQRCRPASLRIRLKVCCSAIKKFVCDTSTKLSMTSSQKTWTPTIYPHGIIIWIKICRTSGNHLGVVTDHAAQFNLRAEAVV